VRNERLDASNSNEVGRDLDVTGASPKVVIECAHFDLLGNEAIA
jgi:hypothetical protein